MLILDEKSLELWTQAKAKNTCGSGNIDKPEDHWSCMAHLSAEDMLKSVVIEVKKLKILNLSDLDQGQ